MNVTEQAAALSMWRWGKQPTSLGRLPAGVRAHSRLSPARRGPELLSSAEALPTLPACNMCMHCVKRCGNWLCCPISLCEAAR